MEEEWRDIKDYEGLYQVSNLGRVKSLNYKNTGIEKIMCPTNNKGYKIVRLYKNSKRKTLQVHRLIAEAFIPNYDNKPCIDHINTIRSDNRVENLRWVSYSENSNNPLTIKHLSNSHKGKTSHMKGKTHSTETKLKISKSHIGKDRYWKDKNRSEETKSKISESLKGKYCGENNPFYGKHLSEESKEMMREKKYIAICQYNKNGELIRYWKGASEAERELGIFKTNIIACCKGKAKTAGGYKWMYAN